MRFEIELFARGVDLSRFRAIYFSRGFNDAVAREVRLIERTQREHVLQPDGTERMRVHVVPQIGLPRAIQALLRGHVISYDEITEYDPATQQARLHITSLAGDAVRVAGEARFTEEAGGVRLCFTGEARIRVLGLGGALERFLVREVTERYRHVEHVLQRFIDERHALEPGTS
jgi:hypothetical protein